MIKGWTRESERQRLRAYRATEKGKAATKAYRQSAKGQASLKAYQQTERYRRKMHRYLTSPKGIATADQQNKRRITIRSAYYGRAKTIEDATKIRTMIRERTHAFKAQQRQVAHAAQSR